MFLSNLKFCLIALHLQRSWLHPEWKRSASWCFLLIITSMLSLFPFLMGYKAAILLGSRNRGLEEREAKCHDRCEVKKVPPCMPMGFDLVGIPCVRLFCDAWCEASLLRNLFFFSFLGTVKFPLSEGVPFCLSSLVFYSLSLSPPFLLIILSLIYINFNKK